MQHRLRAEAMARGVTFIDPSSVILHDGVDVGSDTVIEPGVSLLGATRVGQGCLIEQGSRALLNETPLTDPRCAQKGYARLNHRIRTDVNTIVQDD